MVLIGVGVPFVMAALMASIFALDSRDATEFSMELTGFHGFNATTLGHTVSPGFILRVRAENRHAVVKPWCYRGGDAIVSYSGVALAWGYVPRFCIERKKVPVELTVIPWGREVGLSEDLRRRLASDWKMGNAEVKVEMKVNYDEKGVSSPERKDGPVLKSFQVMLTGH
nr:unnamed protein product [Digitaria exilis]